MGNIASQFATAFRDFVTDGVASSGPHDVIKEEVRAIGPLIEAALGAVSLGSVDVIKDTRANLNADLAHPADSVALVYGDATDANNDLYIKVGASGSGSWTLTTILHDAIEAVAKPFSDLAQAWAEGTEPGGPGTKSAKEWAGEAADSAMAAANSASVAEDARDVAIAAGVQYPSEAAAVAAIANGAFASYLSPTGLPLYGQRTGSTMTPIPGAWFSSGRVSGIPINVLDRGLTNDGVDCQAAMTALMQDTTAKVIRFPAGVYRAYMNNSVSGRTLIFDEGAIIDGVVHIAVGTGPDTHSVPTITWVDNTRVIGTVTSTVRVGSYYCRGLNIDKVVITEVNAAYANQTAEGGTKGVHVYCGSKDVEIGEIICKSATAGVYAVGIDRGPTNNANHLPENVHVGRIVVRDNTQSVLSTNTTVNLTVDEVIANSWDTYGGMTLTADTNLRIGKITMSGAPTTPSKDGIYVLNGVSASFGEVEVSGATQIGFRTFNCGRVDADVIRASNNALDQVRIESPGRIGRIVTSGMGTGVGVLIQGNANGLQVGSIEDTGGGGVTVLPDDVVIDRVVSRNNPATGKYGLWLNGADRFVNNYLLADNCSQGLRMTTVADPTFGNMIISNNQNGIVGSNVTGLAFETVTYIGNATDTNIQLNTVSGFKGSLVRQSVASVGDASVTLTAGLSAVTQVFATSLTANRTVTLSTTGAQNGDKFRVARTAGSGGTGTLTVTGIAGITSITLATQQWAEFEFVGGGWQMTARGSLA